jgi:hypothetical protein
VGAVSNPSPAWNLVAISLPLVVICVAIAVPILEFVANSPLVFSLSRLFPPVTNATSPGADFSHPVLVSDVYVRDGAESDPSDWYIVPPTFRSVPIVIEPGVTESLSVG